jgi:ferredoxin
MAIGTIRYAQLEGLGIGKLDQIEILGEPLKSAVISDFKLPKSSFIYTAPGWAKKIIGSLIRIYPYIDLSSCIRCHICEKNCPAKAIDINRCRIDYSRCVFCFCCNELCPEKAVAVRKGLGGNLFNLIMKARKKWLSRRLNGKITA